MFTNYMQPSVQLFHLSTQDGPFFKYRHKCNQHSLDSCWRAILLSFSTTSQVITMTRKQLLAASPKNVKTLKLAFNVWFCKIIEEICMFYTYEILTSILNMHISCSDSILLNFLAFGGKKAKCKFPANPEL